jgi:hypothetical protein
MIKKEVVVSTSVGSKDNTNKDTNNSESKRILLDTIIKRIDYYCSKNAVTDVDLYYLVKDFFRVYLDLAYEFSLDELILELDRIYLDSEQREKAFKFINSIKIVEYNDSTFSEIQIRGYIMEFSEIAKLLLKNTEYEMGGWWKKFIMHFQKKKKVLGPEDLDYYKQSHTNQQVNVPLPATLSAPIKPTDEETEFEENISSQQSINTYQNAPVLNAEEQNYMSAPVIGRIEEGQESENTSREEILEESEQADAPPLPRDKPKLNLASYDPKSWDEEVDPRILDMEKNDQNTWDNLPVKSQNNSDKTASSKIISTDEAIWPDLEDEDENTISMFKNNDSYELPIDEGDELEEERADPTLRKSLKKYKKEIREEKRHKISHNKTKTANKQKSTKRSISYSSTITDFESPELDKMLEKSNKIKKKAELVELYKKLNSKYVRSKIEIQSKYYDAVMSVYKKIAKLKE